MEWARLHGLGNIRPNNTAGLEPLDLGRVTAPLCSVCVPATDEGHKMPKLPKQPIHGLAKRVDDTVARAMTILQRRSDLTAKPEGSLPPSGRRSQKAT